MSSLGTVLLQQRQMQQVNPQRGITTLATQTEEIQKIAGFSLEERELRETWQLSPTECKDTLKRK